MTESTIEKWDELRDPGKDLQTIPVQPDDSEPNWKFYRDPRYPGERLMLEDHSGLDLARIIKAMWYYRGMFATIALFLATLFVGANKIIMPDLYEATARVRVKMMASIDENQRARTVAIIPTEVLSDKVLTRVIDNLEMTKKTTTPFIAEMLQKAGLEPKAVVEDGTGIMRWLRQEVNIHRETVGSTTAIFSVSLTDKSPEAAAEIVNEIVTNYMALRHTFESSDAAEAVEFLLPRVQAAYQAEQDAHQRLTKFQMDNGANLIPATILEENIIRLEEEFTNSEKRVAQLKELNIGLNGLIKDIPRWVAAGTVAADAPSAASAELTRMEQRLVQAQATYASGHTYLKQLRAQIAALEKAAKKAPRRVQRGGNGRVTNPEWLRMQQEITANDAEMRVLIDRMPTLERQIDDLAGHLSRSTSAQAALLSHQSAWDSAYNQYRILNERLLSAQTQAEAQSSDVGKELEVLDKATAPSLPITASRTKLQMLGVLGGFAIAFAIVLVYTRIKNFEIPTEGRQVGILTSIFLNLLGFAWLTALIGYIVIAPYV